MNRWSKYGGILPETINISGIEIIQESTYLDSGNPNPAPNYQRTNSYIPVTQGTYELKFIIERTDTLSSAVLKILGYDENKNYIGVADRINTRPITNIGAILKYKVTITNQKYIRMSYRTSLLLMEIEKL